MHFKNLFMHTLLIWFFAIVLNKISVHDFLVSFLGFLGYILGVCFVYSMYKWISLISFVLINFFTKKVNKINTKDGRENRPAG